MRVLIVEHKTVWGGGQVALVNVLWAWQEMGADIEPVVACPPGAALGAQVRELGIDCVELELGAIEKTRGVAWNLTQRAGPTGRLWRLMRQKQIELVIANGAFSYLATFAAARIAAKPVVWIEHNVTLPDGALLARMIDSAGAIVAVSQAIRKQFTQLVPEADAKIEVVYNGVDTERFRVMRDKRESLRREFGWSEDALVVGTVSRLAPEKGVGDFVEACALVARQMSQARFMIVGDGPLRTELEERAAELSLTPGHAPLIRFVGMREDVPELLNTMDVFGLASRAEAFGIAAIEAMACELPVVASDVGGLPEIVIPGETGLLVPSNDPPTLANAILGLLCDPSRRAVWGREGRVRVQAHFTVNAQATQLYQVLKDTHG